MTRISSEPPPYLSAETRAVLDAMVGHPDPLGLRLNELADLTGLPVANVGRQLRALEGDRLTSFGAGRWRPMLRGRRVADELARRPPEHEAPSVVNQ